MAQMLYTSQRHSSPPRIRNVHSTIHTSGCQSNALLTSHPQHRALVYSNLIFFFSILYRSPHLYVYTARQNNTQRPLGTQHNFHNYTLNADYMWFKKDILKPNYCNNNIFLWNLI